MVPKGETDTQGISLLETLRKFMDAIIDPRLWSIIQLHDVLHGFCVGRGMGTATMDINIAQDFSNVDQDLLFVVFLNLRKA